MSTSRFPLIVNAGAAQIQELPYGDNLDIAGGNIANVADITASGNITAGYFIGNGSQLTGLPATNNYSNANVASYLPINTSNVAADNVSALGNVSGSFILGNAAYMTGIPNQLANFLPTYSGPVSANALTIGNTSQTVLLTAPIVASQATTIQLATVSFAVNFDWVLQSSDDSSVSIGKGFVAANTTSIAVTSYGNSSVGSGLGNVSVDGTGMGNIVFTASAGSANGIFNLLVTEFLS